MDDAVLEAIAENVHQAWMAEKRRQGFAPHPLTRCTDSFWPGQCGYPDAKHHTDMLPYTDLPEHIKDYDRVTARAAFEGITAAGYRIEKNETPTR